MQFFAAVSRRLAIVAIIGLWLVLLVAQQPRDGVGTDFYPIYWAAQVLRAGQNPYGPEMTARLVQAWRVPFAAAGLAYPLPTVVSAWPLLLLPLPLATVLWTSFGAVGSAAVIGLRSNWRSFYLLPFLFMPLHRAILMKQATLVWVALVVIMIVAQRRRWAWLSGLCIVVLPAKPQVGLLFAIAGCVIAWREHKQVLPWIVGWGILIWGGSFWLQPDWVQAWLASVARYNAIVATATVLPWGLVLLLVTWRLPWYARLAAAQVVLFPLSDVYSALPLLLIWIALDPPIALAGSAVSWVWVLAGLPNTITMFWVWIMLPLIIGCMAQTMKRRRFQHRLRMYPA